jgi:uncharacterized protein with PQ loop repeat
MAQTNHRHLHIIDKIAFANGIISGLALYPQVWLTYTGGFDQSVSALSFLLIFINSIVWFLYALHRSLLSLAITSILNCIASGLLVILSFAS